MDTSILENMHILLVEDDIVNQMLFQRSFYKLNTKITIVDNGQKAIELLRKEKFDLVVMDIYLPDMDGCQATGHIRSDLKSDIPVIAITASPIDEEIKRCISSGMSGYIRKPFTLNQLTDIISKVVPAEKEQKNSDLIGNDVVTIDLHFLKTISDNDKEYITQIIKAFIENIPATIKKMNQCYTDGDRDNLAKTAHFAKSSLSVIQIPQMFQQALVIESETKKIQLPDEKIKIAVDAFSNQFENAKNILNEYIATF